MDSSPALVYVTDLEGRYITVNRQWELVVGISRQEARGKTAFDVFPRHIAEQFRANEREAFAAGGPVEREETLPLEDGLHVYRTLKFPVRAATGDIVAVCGISTDITDRKRAEKELLDSQENLRLLVENIHDYAIFMLDASGLVVSWNSGAERLYGYSAAEIIGQHVSRTYPEENVPAAVPDAVLRKAEAAGRVEEQGWRIRKDGSSFFASAVVTALRNPDGSLRGFARITRDMTQQKAAEDALRQAHQTLELDVRERTRELESETAGRRRIEQELRRSEEYYRSLIENALDITGILAPDGTIRYISPAVERVLGYTREQVTGTNAFALIHPDDVAAAAAALRREAQVRDAPGPIESYRFRAQDGSWRFLDVAGRNLLDVPAISGIVFTARDVTESARAREKLQESQHFIESVAEMVPDALYVYDLVRSRVVYANRPIVDFLPAGVLGMTGEELAATVHPEDAPILADRIRSLARAEGGEVVEAEYRVRGRSGEWRWIYSRTTVFKRAPDGSAEQIVGTAQDITARKQAEQALEQTTETLRALAAKLLVAEEEERKALSRELHDDLNQRLAIIAFEIGVLARGLPPSPDEIRRELQAIESRVAELTDDVRRMAHLLRPSILDDLGLVPALRSYCADFSRRERIRVRFTQHHVAEPVRPETALCLYRVAQEALRNVAKHSGSKRAAVRVGTAAGHIWLFVRDYGSGFDPAAARSARGLGIISMQERVRLAGGHISVRSRPGAGTRIAVRIPLQETSQGATTTPSSGR